VNAHALHFLRFIMVAVTVKRNDNVA